MQETSTARARITEADLGLEPDAGESVPDTGHGFAILNAGLIGRRLTDVTPSQPQPQEAGPATTDLFARKGDARPSDLNWAEENDDKDVAIAFERLRQGVIALTVVLGERESALAQARLALELAHGEAEQNAATAVSQAEAGWKAREASRLTRLETEWREKASKAANEAAAAAEARWKIQEAARVVALEVEWRDKLETASAAASATAVAERDEVHRRELETLRGALISLQKAVADRDAALAEARAAAAPVTEENANLLKTALADAETAWRAGEDARFAAAEARWREQTAAAQRDAAARARAAEEALAMERERARAARETSYLPEVTRLREELAIAKRHLADRDRQISRLRTMIEQGDTGPVKTIDLEATRAMVRFEPPPRPIAQRSARGVVVAAVMGVVAVAAYSLFPSLLDALAPEAPPVAVAATSPPTLPALADLPANPVPSQPMALVTRGVNLRGGPSVETEVIGWLPPGTSVAILEESGNWRRVRIEGATGDQPQEAWVYGSFLDATGAAAQ